MNEVDGMEPPVSDTPTLREALSLSAMVLLDAAERPDADGNVTVSARLLAAALATPPAPAGDDSPCVFVPAIEWTCTTHEGFRTSLNEDRCRGRGGRRRTDTAALDVEALLDAMSIVHRYPEAGGMNHREMGEAYAREYEKLREGSLHPIAVTR